MNELFVLGELMEGPHTGYQLRCAMQMSLGWHRKISFGVIYPLLDKLSTANFIDVASVPSGRNKNIATITAKGKERFYALMEQPVADNAYKVDIYMIKLDVMQHLPVEWQLKLLDEYTAEQEKIIHETTEAIHKLSKEVCRDHWYAEKKLELRLQQARVAIQWAGNFCEKLPDAPLGDNNEL